MNLGSISFVDYTASTNILRLMMAFQEEVEKRRTLTEREKELYTIQAQRLCEEILEGRNQWCSVALNGTKVVGIKVAHKYSNSVDKFRRKDVLEMTKLYVLPEFRRKSIGKNLDLHLLQRISALEGIDKIIETIEESNKPAISLKTSLGFKQKGQYVGEQERVYNVYGLNKSTLRRLVR